MHSRLNADCVNILFDFRSTPYDLVSNGTTGGAFRLIDVVARYYVPTPTRDPIRGVTRLSHGSPQREFLVAGALHE